MFARIRIALGLAALLSIVASTSALAKGGFDFIAVTGADLETEIRFTARALTEDFFAFASFYENKTEAPADPGTAYEITRHYSQGARDIIFDRLHYYPETGFVFYDGIENGESEYDGEWYTARPEIKPLFEAALAAQMSAAPVGKKPPGETISGLRAESEGESFSPARTGFERLPLLAGGLAVFAALAALAALATLAKYTFRRRKPLPR